MNKILLKLVFLLATINVFSQSQGTALIIVDTDAKLSIDGGNKEIINANTPKKYTLMLGEHFIQLEADINGAKTNRSQVLTIEADKQKVVQIEFSDTQEKQVLTNNVTEGIITVADLNFTIPGSLAVGSWLQDHPNETYPFPRYFYAFEKGDKIVLNFSMSNNKGTNIIEVVSYPDKVIKYSNKSCTELNDLEITVEERSIFEFLFATNFAFDRNAKITIGRIPASEATKDFNTSVALKKKYKAITLQPSQDFWVNSGSNAALGGRSRITLPLEFPKNTVEWYYKFAASRNANEIAQTKEKLHLVGELTQLISGFTGGALNIAVEELTQPPGANYCDVFLLNKDNLSPFEQKTEFTYITEGTMANYISGVVQMKCCTNDIHYIGVRNPDTFYGIQVAIEVVAIVMEQVLERGQD